MPEEYFDDQRSLFTEGVRGLFEVLGMNEGATATAEEVGELDCGRGRRGGRSGCHDSRGEVVLFV